ncbi:STAS domain-containing protein [Imhoffiella purpurea]|uniref:Putative STAS domain protein n=1 Tax=Imhoffiella purpurea TaxID=1249627 RepID=W9VX02_9GAMM|nr:STAS domain-containing protein [Imhoffiella purpurea]EXJ14950.1 putative STAS domain protein [Imhoffiella purpurea]
MSEAQVHSALCLEGELNIYCASETKMRLMEFLSRAEDPSLDLSAVTELDTAGLQVLILARQEAERMRKPLRFLNPSDSVRDVFDLCNLTVRFGDARGLESNS